MEYYTLTRFFPNYRKWNPGVNKTYGSVIKHHRKKQNLTLEETCENICSISYLCKVENNKLAPSDKILPKLLKRLNINEEIFNYDECFDWIDDIIREDRVNDEILRTISKKTDYQAKLIKFAEAVLNIRDVDVSYRYYVDITDYFEYFKMEEVAFFYYIVMRSYYINDQLSNVVKIYDILIQNLKKDHVILQAQTMKVKALYKLNRIREANDLFNSMYRPLVDKNFIDVIIDLKNYEIAAKCKTLNKEDMEEEMSLYNTKSAFKFDHFWFNHYYYYKKDFESSYIHINKIKLTSEHFYVFYLINLDKLNKKDELREVLSNPPFKVVKITSNLVQNYLRAKHSEVNQLKFIRSSLLYNKSISEEIAVADYLYTESLKYLKNKHFYKESVAILEKYTKSLKTTLDDFL